MRQRAERLCEYCLLHEEDGVHAFHVDHVISEKHGGNTVAENLAYACVFCNQAKGSDVGSIHWETNTFVRLFNPRTEKWNEHFRWSADGTEILGISPIGRATVIALKLNNEIILISRRLWVSVGWFPPED